MYYAVNFRYIDIHYLGTVISISPREPGEDLLLDPEYPVPVAGALEVLPEAPLVRAGDEADAARRAGGDLSGLQELILLARNSIKGTYLHTAWHALFKSRFIFTSSYFTSVAHL